MFYMSSIDNHPLKGNPLLYFNKRSKARVLLPEQGRGVNV